jgi:hypothetical protein
MHQPTGLKPFYWLGIEGGTHAYVRAVRESLKGTTLHLNTAIERLEKKGFLLAQGIVISVLAVLLFFIPNYMSTIWPWKVAPALAQMYAGPLLSYGLGSVLFSRQDKWLGIRAIVPGMFAFTAATVIVSFIHIILFTFTELADVLWFGSFGIAMIILGVLTVRVMQMRA